MPLSGEAIRTMNYVDDISVTLRRILTVLPSLTEEERQRGSRTAESQLKDVRHDPDQDTVDEGCREPAPARIDAGS